MKKEKKKIFSYLFENFSKKISDTCNSKNSQSENLSILLIRLFFAKCSRNHYIKALNLFPVNSWNISRGGTYLCSRWNYRAFRLNAMTCKNAHWEIDLLGICRFFARRANLQLHRLSFLPCTAHIVKRFRSRISGDNQLAIYREGKLFPKIDAISMELHCTLVYQVSIVQTELNCIEKKIQSAIDYISTGITFAASCVSFSNEPARPNIPR